MNALEKKQLALRTRLLDIIINGVLYYPSIGWDDDNDDNGYYSPSIEYKKREDEIFKDLPELIKTLRDLADSLEQQTIKYSDEENVSPSQNPLIQID